MGKGEIARYEQFLLFPQCFLKACFPEASKGVIVWEWVNATLTARSYHGRQWRTCVSWLSHTSKNTFLSKAIIYSSCMFLQRWEAKICQKESSPLPGIELTTTRSWVRHAHHWATWPGLISRAWVVVKHCFGEYRVSFGKKTLQLNGQNIYKCFSNLYSIKLWQVFSSNNLDTGNTTCKIVNRTILCIHIKELWKLYF